MISDTEKFLNFYQHYPACSNILVAPFNCSLLIILYLCSMDVTLSKKTKTLEKYDCTNRLIF